MASVLKLKTDIKKLKAAIASKATSGAIKTKLRGKLTTLENELDKLQPNKRKPKTTGPKSESALVRLAKKRRTNQGLSTSKSDIDRDAVRPAKKAGKRISANGNRYYEYRDNRIDNRQPPKKYRKLADGGMMAKGGKVGMYELMPYVSMGQMRSGAMSNLSSPSFKERTTFEGTQDEAIMKAKNMVDNSDGRITSVEVSIINPKATNVLKMTKKIEMVRGTKMDHGGYMADGGKVGQNYEIELFFKGLSGDNRKIGKYVVSQKTLDNLENYLQADWRNDISLDIIAESNKKPTSWADLKTAVYAKYTEVFGKKANGGMMADGGKTQGYDDKKDESLGMTRGKLSLKDFVGNRKQKEHSRRDDARFEERGMMAKGGDLSLVKKKYDENEDENAHSENVVLLAKHFGTKGDLAKAKEILALHQKEGYLSSENGKKRIELHLKLIDKATAEMDKQGIKFEKGGYMAKGGKTKDQEVVRGYFEDEAYEYLQGGNLRFNNVSIHISKNTEEDMRNAGFTFDPKGNAPLYYNGKEVGYLSNFNGVMLNDEYVDELVPMFNTFRDAGVWNYRGWKEEADARKRHYGNKMADGGELAKQKAESERTALRGIGQDYMKRLTAYRNLFEVNSQTYKLINDRIYDLNSIEIDFLTHADKDLRTDLSDGGKMADGGYMADGGSVAKGNYEMLMSQAKEVMHHAEELMQVVKPNMDIEAWVVSKAERATTDLSDITHYLDGLKMAMGGMVKANTHKVNA